MRQTLKRKGKRQQTRESQNKRLLPPCVVVVVRLYLLPSIPIDKTKAILIIPGTASALFVCRWEFFCMKLINNEYVHVTHQQAWGVAVAKYIPIIAMGDAYI